MTQQCEHHLAASSLAVYSTRLLIYGSDKCHLILEPKSTIYSWLAPVVEDFACAPALQAYVERIFFCVCAAFCVVANEIAHSSHLKCARLKLNQKVCVC